MYTLEGVSNVANFITAYEESHLNRDSYLLKRSRFSLPKGYLFDVLFSFLKSILIFPDTGINTMIPRKYKMQYHVVLE